MTGIGQIQAASIELRSCAQQCCNFLIDSSKRIKMTVDGAHSGATRLLTAAARNSSVYMRRSVMETTVGQGSSVHQQ